ncbi:hypothetical protein H6G33_09330 [Calothrix sp. FACHB-1219]|uniref:hypothetical protein n=1 Tax=unclassified Calothrix TaxID=2619626 RepID=UPI001685B216|nr:MULTISPECIES: hypothetical protein [unclassified Calothrix]MBD2201547.1 hypothetical protein [Calothrix sp. FACHB-168]MBD2217233.1 hypothetical protein [Calothrix sp. FACHB-1219]
MKVWSQSENVPAACITYAGGNSNNQPILFTTQHSHKGTYIDVESKKTQEVILEWTIKSVEVTLVRDWGTSTALVILVCNLPDHNTPVPPLPDLSIYRGGNYPNLTYEDEIRIYAGYLASPTIPISADLLDETPVRFNDYNGKEYTPDSKKPLAPIFWGFIDKLEFSGDTKGLQLILSCRDRTRILADTRILSLPQFQGVANTGNEIDATGVIKGDRIPLLHGILNAAAGYTALSKDECRCWKPVNLGPKNVQGFAFDVDNSVIIKPPTDNPAEWLRYSTLRPFAHKAEPRLNVWAERPPVVKGNPNSTIQVINKTPMEVIDYMAKSEERPTDFFASHVNGDFIFGPRSIDFSGFEDEDRSYRTYFFRTWPKELNAAPPSPNQIILSIKTLSSTIATFNKFVVIDAKTKSQGKSLLNSVKQGIYSMPWQLEGRNPSPPCRTQICYDAAIGTYSNENEGAIIVGMSAARIWSRDVNGIQVKLLGDPTFYPGEAIRVYNTLLHDNNILIISDYTEANNKDKEIRSRVEGIAKESENLSNNDKLDPCLNTKPSELFNEMVGITNPGRSKTTLSKLVLPIYKIRTVQHKIVAQGQKGWTTSLSSTADYSILLLITSVWYVIYTLIYNPHYYV